jgi:hypothetical protein
LTIDERLEALTQSLELLAHQRTDSDARLSAAAERHDREMEDIRREGRNARRRRQGLDEKITQFAAAQLVTEEKLQQFIIR